MNKKNLLIVGVIALIVFVALLKMTNHTKFQFAQDYELKPLSECNTYQSCEQLFLKNGYTEDQIKEIIVCDNQACYIKTKKEVSEVHT